MRRRSVTHLQSPDMAATVNTVLLILLTSSVNGFEITGVYQSVLTVEPGQGVSVRCTSSEDWEYCVWSQTARARNQCTLEWKRSKGGVSIEDCGEDLRRRVKVAGDYRKRECGLHISNLTVEDSGTWQCEMEEYMFGDWSSGRKQKAEITLNVREITPTEHPILITRVYSTEQVELTTLMVPDVTTETESATEMTTGLDGDYSFMSDDNETWYDTMAQTVIAVNQTETRTLESTTNVEPGYGGTIVGVLLSGGCLLVFIAAGVMVWRRKHSAAVVTRQGEENWVAEEMADVVPPSITMSQLANKETQ